MNWKKLFTNWRVLTLLFLIVVSFWVISYSPGSDGAAIRVVQKDSSGDLAGIESPTSKMRPMDREVISAINGQVVLDENDYYALTSNLSVNETYVIKTDKSTYSLDVLPEYEYVTLNETETYTKEIFNETLNATQNITLTRNKVVAKLVGAQDLGLKVYDAPTSNLKMGLDLQGGTRVIIQPVKDNLTADQFDMIKSNLEQRLNVYGLSDVTVSVVKNFKLEPEYILIEIAGITVDEIEDLILSQGKFEAKIGDVVVFSGDNNDIVYVGKGPQESRIETCQKDAETGGDFCRFSFAISLSPSAAEKQAGMTDELEVVGDYLNATLDLYLDDELVSDLRISAGLKGQAVTQISISGSGAGNNREEAMQNALAEMKKLQTVIEAGSLPSALTIVKSDTISPSLGEGFTKNALQVGLIALLTVALVLFIRYRKFKIIIPMVISLASEVFLVLGAYSLFGWVLDLASIAGIIIVVGTGVDHLVVITDEVLRQNKSSYDTWKTKMKSAFAIIIGAFLTTAFAMIPLLVAGAGLLRGFAITTLTGLFVGVLIVRPTYGKIVEILLK